MYRQSETKHKLDTTEAYIGLRSNKKVTFKKVQMRTHEMYVKSPLIRCSKMWEMLKPEVQRANTKVKFKYYVNQMCRPKCLLID